MKTALAIVGAIALLLVFGLLAVCNDDEGDPDSFGPIRIVELADHDYGGDYGCDPYYEDCGGGGQDYDYDYGSHDRNRNRGRDRGAFSPDLQDSPVTVIICPPGTQYCGSDGGPSPRPPEGGRA